MNAYGESVLIVITLARAFCALVVGGLWEYRRGVQEGKKDGSPCFPILERLYT